MQKAYLYNGVRPFDGTVHVHACSFFFALHYSPPRSRVNSNSKNEMNIRISLCNVRRVNEMLDISLEVVPKKTH